jgi:enolase
VSNVTEAINKEISGYDVREQLLIDQALVDLDGTPNKSNLGANAILGTSLAVAKAAAMECNLPLFRYIGGPLSYKLPVPLMNVLNGGAHANNGLDIQEFMIVPMKETFSDSLRCGSEIFHTLKKILAEQGLSTAVGDEGGFAPVLKSNKHALELLMKAIEKAGYLAGDDVHLALDVAATELFKDGKYTWEEKTLSSAELLAIYDEWKTQFPLISIEDGFSEDDWEGWQNATATLGQKLQLVGDDLFVTNVQRLAQGIQTRSANSILIKVNQIGTLSETIEAIRLAQSAGFTTVMSHRSGETEDTIIADLAVGLSCHQIKTGSLCRSDRTAKYNQLLRIEESLEGTAAYWGEAAFKQL